MDLITKNIQNIKEMDGLEDIDDILDIEDMNDEDITKVEEFCHEVGQQLKDKCKMLLYDIIMHDYPESKHSLVLEKLKKFIWIVKDTINSIGFQSGYGLFMLMSKYNSSFHIRISEIFIENGLDVNNVDHHNYTALHHAVYNKNLPFIKFLLENGADCNIPDEKSYYPIMTAALIEDIEVIKLLIEYGASIDICSDDGLTPLYLFIQKEYIDLIFDIMDNIEHSNLLIKTDTDHTLLMIASEVGSVQMVKYLLRKGANVYDRSSYGWNAMHYASKYGHIKVMEILCKHGVDINIETDQGETCLFLMPIYDIECLLNNPTFHEINLFHTLPLLSENILHHLCCKDSDEFYDESNTYILHLLLNKGVPINQRNEIGNTALHNACVYNKKYVVELFLRYGAIMDIPNNYGYLPCHIAAIRKHYEIIAILYFKEESLLYMETSDKRNVYDILKLDPSLLGAFPFSEYDDYDEHIKKISNYMKVNSS